jgi:phenylalanyl-tRNA synthetase beta chain
MRILQSWLKDYISFSMTPEHLAERLGKLGIEVAGIERLGEKYKGFVVGEVLSVERHPNADRLTVCTVNTGSETLQIVCGAPNVAPGQKVPVGLVGATVPRNQHDPDGKPFVLSLVKVRGVESQGMICSEYELDLGKDADGILVLDPSAKTGRPLAKHLGRDDVAYEVELTPNRPDCLSHFGIAREIGVLTGKTPKLPAVRLKEGSHRIREFLKITVEDRANCPRFAARMIRGVTIGPSPAWLQSRLTNIGLRPINNIVDVTNYVMVETGHPLHAFDFALLKGGSIVVRQSVPGSGFTTLDGKTHTLPSSAVMVCDAEREVSIAGVMGGANSEIRESTVDIVLEAAYWNPASIRRTAKALGISTDASQRFERGADPNGVTYALDRAASLVHQLAGGELLKGTIDVYPKKIRERVISLRTERVNTVLGTELGQQQIAGFLAKLGIRSTKGKPGTLRCVIPTYRVDQEREIDLIEEVARVFGYDRIELKTSTLVNLDQSFPLRTLSDSTREVLIGAGFTETISSSTTDERSARLAGPDPVRLLNPLGVETAFMRTSLIPGLLQSVARNQNFGNNDLRLFEIGHVFAIDASARNRFVEDYAEAEKVALLLAGEAQPVQWSMTPRKVDLFDIKGAVSALVEKISLDKCDFIYYRTSDGLTDSALAIDINGGYAGYLGRVKPSLLTDLGIAGEVFIAELRLATLEPGKVKHYEQLSRYPKVRRDISLFVDVAVPVGEIEGLIRRAAGELLSSVVLFDLYQGEKAPEGKKSLAFSLELMSRQKTLTETEIEGSIRRVVDALAKEFGSVLRSVQ